ncbi:MAG: CGGC domain-containing protein [Clostridia bacterium]|nr:CGGC domain-containing protein [Clostridia bacterium]
MAATIWKFLGKESSTIRAAIIGCAKCWRTGCPGINSHVLCPESVRQKRGPLGRLGGLQIVSLVPCPGCSQDGLLKLVQDLGRDGVQVIAFASCLFLPPPCPYVEKAAVLANRLQMKVLMGSYLTPDEAMNSSLIPRGSPLGSVTHYAISQQNWLYFLGCVTGAVKSGRKF